MVAIREVRAANASLKSSKQSLTAVFTGATSGIGKATVQSFAKHIPQPTAIIVGRSQKAFAPELENLRSINPDGTYVFLEEDISLIKNIDAVSQRIASTLQEKSLKIDLVFLSQGYISFNGRETNADGLDTSVSLRYYGRVRFAQNLLPYTAPEARIVSILAGGQEATIIEDDLALERNYSVGNAMGHPACMLTLSWDAFAAQNSDKAFLHVFPGLTSTGLLGRSATGVLGLVMRWVVEPILKLTASKPEDIGERMFYYATTEEFEKGSWSLDWDGTPKENAVLKGYRERGFKDVVVEHNERVFERAVSR
ncbi:hypothetical protein M409DRAFT_24467 [Zasmidium cellare ATCC 36951]|uniref:Ketoreductase (KR) domain-containing protein n=1 Tax=Zasmidium cellare ATCC 36951 TaxID=1080233 RepID=A0A6A6CHB6_ZASCE|nr:uncharacterized protein M409DRAFT_24467 [Zasmidium cellare ATCC 36951]KAF2165079.1 hypothetical protein M409DRAFT_24467 [Zasmidium cellare ATCC 36951]